MTGRKIWTEIIATPCIKNIRLLVSIKLNWPMAGVPLSYIGIPQTRRDLSVKFKIFKNSAIGCIIKRIFSRPDGPIGDLAVQAGQLADCDAGWHPVGPVSQGEGGAQRRQAGWGLDPPAAECPRARDGHA